ncbi:2'-5' RNA ligase family protein [Streptomyces sp. NBC_01465]|uniref:2'-5' RNA ligase family protein n=1 Tax=Streptomyces sp. NBC_01465 TaxID=2903878 RepID=UPI002E368F07|nr:2'-5' RNA ligase family protein [Streptomyces sp. NBC_01465]
MAQLGTTAVLAVVPEAGPLLKMAAEADPRVVRSGVPAHAALLYPWLPADDVDDRELERLRAAVPTGPVRLRLTAVERRDGFVAVALPELRAVATALRALYPAHVPYGGRFGQDPPVHLTVALDADAHTATAIAERTAVLLPIDAEVTALSVVTLTPAGWRELAELPLSAIS